MQHHHPTSAAPPPVSLAALTFLNTSSTSSSSSNSPSPAPSLSPSSSSSGTLSVTPATTSSSNTGHFLNDTASDRSTHSSSGSSAYSSSSSAASSAAAARRSITVPPPANHSFLPTGMADECRVDVDDTNPAEYIVAATLPGFDMLNITVALKRAGVLHLLADKWVDTAPNTTISESTMTDSNNNNNHVNESCVNGCHFERLVDLGPDAIGQQARASWNAKDEVLTVRISRKPMERWQQKEYEFNRYQQHQYTMDPPPRNTLY